MLTGYYQKEDSKKDCELYQDNSKEEKNKKRLYGCKQYRNFR